MASATQISLLEYLKTSFRPDVEFVDGELRERNVGKKEHARLQMLLGAWFERHEQEWGVWAFTDWRMQVSPTRVRIPDLVVTATDPQEEVLSEPPLLAIEILSPDDTYADLRDRSRDYIAMGVETIWIIDPRAQTGELFSNGSWVERNRLDVPGTPVFVNLPELFARMSGRSW